MSNPVPHVYCSCGKKLTFAELVRSLCAACGNIVSVK